MTLVMSRYTHTGNVRSKCTKPVQAKGQNSRKAVQNIKQDKHQTECRHPKCGDNIQGIHNEHRNRQGINSQIQTM